MSGRIFTRVSGDGLKYSKLDRFLVTEKFLHPWRDLTASVMDRHLSDHCAIILKDEERNFGPKPFKVFDAWLDQIDIEEVIQSAWDTEVLVINRKDCIFRNRLKNVINAIKEWSINKFDTLEGEIEVHRLVAQNLELKAEHSVLDESELKSWRNSRKLWFEKEKIKSSILKQKARIKWVLEGDENSKFFHSMVRMRNNKNTIRGLLVDGSWKDNPEDIKYEAVSHFSNRFKEPDIERPSLEDLEYPILTSSEASKLEETLEEKEIRDTNFDCDSTKAPGPDVIPSLVGPEQSAFLKGRFILDGALIVNECIDFLRSSRKKGIIFKVDFEKAFDCINWEFLLEVMRCMGFGYKWCKWIRSCLTTALISILVNGSPTKEFSIERGVRQGDPLSHFLFIFAAKGLNILAKSALDKGLFKGIEVGVDKVLVSHLQYADDTIFMGECSRANARSLQNLLKCFELASGLKVNFHKSCVYGIGVSNDELLVISNQFGCQVDSFPFTYLGLPIGCKMTKLKDWYRVIDKVKNRLSNWKMRTMSYGGRLVLIKSVLSSLPLHFFLLYRAPNCVIKLLESVRRKFFWGGSDSGTKISGVKWDTILNSYGKEGLNIGSLKGKTLALLAKWWWRFKTEANSLWVRVIRSIYGSCGGVGSGGDIGYHPALGTWHNIIVAGNTLEDIGIGFKNSFIKSIGNGSDTSFWNCVGWQQQTK
ncbi:uncharacterized protein [Rutidosis leptorrhynchoides]|uniref:uncharacterized protein n=1 Tax=Rutidosis leptorrhynchoides TaxID=125765 RepID=UPI003A99C5A0